MGSQVTLWPRFGGSSPSPPSMRNAKRSSPNPKPSPIIREDGPRNIRRRVDADTYASRVEPGLTRHEHQVGSDFCEAFAQMSVVNLELQQNVIASQEEINVRQYDNNNLPRPATHVELIASPPSSPGSIMSLEGYQKVTNKDLATHLRQTAFEDLQRADNKFRGMMKELSGIREWWFDNCGQHAFKKLQLQRKEKSIKSLIKQQKSHHEERAGNWLGGQSFQEDMSHDGWLEQQIQLQEREIVTLKGWFIENRLLMKSVYEKFQDIKVGVHEVAALPTREDISIQIHLSYIYPQTRDWTITTILRPTATGLGPWLENVQDDFLPYHEYLIRLRDAAAEKRDLSQQLQAAHEARVDGNVAEYAEEEEEFDNNIQRLREKAINDPENKTRYDEQMQNGIFLRNRNRFKREEQQRLCNLVEISFLVQETANLYTYENLKDRIWRSKTILELVGRYLTLYKSLEEGKQLPVYLITDLVNICYWEFERQKCTWLVDDLVKKDNEAGKPYHEKRVIEHMQAHLHEESIQKKFTRLLTGSYTAEVLPLYLDKVKQLWEKEAKKYTEAAQTANEIADHFRRRVENLTAEDITGDADEIDISQYTSKALPPQLPATPFLQHIGPWGWMMPSEISAAVRILEHTHVKKGPTNYNLFNDFFNSPDIFPLFRIKDMTWTQKEFLEKVQDLVINEISEKVMEAFLTWCDYTEEMFLISKIRGRVYVSPKGWHRAYDSPVSDSLARKVQVERPQGTRKLERLMLIHQDKFGLDEESRRFEKRTIMTILKQVVTNERNTLIHTTQFYLNYWNQVGRFFVTTDQNESEDNEWESQLVERVDVGWNFERINSWAPFSTKPPDFDRLDGLVRSTDLRPVFTFVKPSNIPIVTEEKLYRFVFLRGSRRLNPDYTRYGFHMYLRWCDKTKSLFSFKRDGIVVAIQSRARSTSETKQPTQ